MRSNASATVMVGRWAGRNAGALDEADGGFDFGEAVRAIHAALGRA